MGGWAFFLRPLLPPSPPSYDFLYTKTTYIFTYLRTHLPTDRPTYVYDCNYDYEYEYYDEDDVYDDDKYCG